MEIAVDIKIKGQKEFVRWWREAVRRPGGKEAQAIRADRGELVLDDASAICGKLPLGSSGPFGLEEFFRGYGTPFAAAVAAINTVITLTVGQYFTLYSQHEIVAARDAEAARRIAIREGLGSFVAEGDGLMARCGDPKKPVPLDQTNEWANRVEAFLSTQLGQSYVNRFRDSTVTPPASLPGADSEHLNVWAQIYFRVLRLEQFSQQMTL